MTRARLAWEDTVAMETGLIVLAAIMAVAIAALALSRSRGRGADVALDQRLDSLNQRLGELTGQSATYRETMDSVNRALGGLTQTSQRLLEVGKGMRDLQDVLAAPTLRGGLGELMLGAGADGGSP